MHLLRRGTGYPILFIHGMPTSHQLWNGVIQQMCGTFTCFAVDLPGLGKSPSEPYRPNYLQRVAARLDALRIQHKIERWHVVGHDAGSAIAVHYAHLFQQHTGGLALLSPSLFPDLKPYFLLEFLRKPVLGEVLAPLVNPLFWNVAMRRASRNNEGAPDPGVRCFHERFSGWGGPWQFMRLMRWGKPVEVLARVPEMLPRLRVPTLIVQGSRDPAIPASFAHRAFNLIPNSELVRVDCGHFIPLNRPTFLAHRLLSFFNRQIEAWESNDQSCATVLLKK